MAADKIFVGRKDELEQFKEVLEEPQGQAVLVVGQAGMGKTWLVNEMVERAQQGVLGKGTKGLKCWSVRYEITPDAAVTSVMEQIIIDASEAAAGVRRRLGMTGEHKEKWAALFGASEVIPVFGKSIKALGDLLLSIGAQRGGDTKAKFLKALRKLGECMKDNQRAVFVIDPEKWMPKESDGAWRLVVRDLPEKIKLVFPQRPDDVLTTSGQFCGLKNVVRIPEEEVGILDAQAIDKLVASYAVRTGLGANELHKAIERYKGHPYAVAAALGLIEDDPEIEKLPIDPTPEGIVKEQRARAFGKSGDAVKLLEAYAILEVGVPDDVVEAVGEVSAASRKSLMEDKYVGSLLREEGYGRRIYHAILADYILEQIEEDEKKKYHERAVGVYRGKLEEAEKAQSKPDALAAMRLAEHVLAAEGKEAFVDALINECYGPLTNLGLLDAALGLSERGLKLVGKGSVEEAVLRGNLGLIYRTRGELDKAEEMHRKALEINEKLGRLEGTARDYGNLGLIEQDRGDLDKAEQMYHKVLKIEEKPGRPESIANAYGNLGGVYLMKGDLDKAEQMLRKALEINEKLGRLEGMAGDYGNLGLIYQTRGELETAEEMHRKSLEIEKKLGRLEGMANDYGNLGLIYYTKGELDRAEEMFHKVLKIEGKLGRPESMAKVYGNLGLIEQDRGDLDKAEEMYRKSLEIEEKLGRLEGMAINYGNLGGVYKERGEIEKAREYWEKALELYKKIGMPHMVEEVEGWIRELK